MSKGKPAGGQRPPAETMLPAVLPRASLEPSRGTPLGACPTNLDLTTLYGKSMAIVALSPSDLEIGANGSVQVNAVAYLIFPDQGIDPETGELHEFSRTVLFDSAGRTFRTTSATMPHRLAAVLSLFGPQEWAAGVPLIISERKSRKTGRTYHDMRVAYLPPPQEGEDTQ